MNYLLSLFCFLFAILPTLIFASDKKESTGKLVAITNYSQLNYKASEKYLIGKKDELVGQIDEVEFEQIRRFINNPVVPCEMLRYCISGLDTIRNDFDSLKRRLTQLHFYKIATFTHTEKNGIKATYCILRVPYRSNENWDKKVKWEIVYFFINNKAVTEINYSPDSPAYNRRVEGVNVKVSDWGRSILLFGESTWKNSAEEIVKQIGINEFKNVITYSDRYNIPCEMQQFCQDKNGQPKKEDKKYHEDMDRLLLFRIATFKKITPTGENKGEYCILRATYSNNKDWNITARWDTVYFVMPCAVVQERKKSGVK